MKDQRCSWLSHQSTRILLGLSPPNCPCSSFHFHSLFHFARRREGREQEALTWPGGKLYPHAPELPTRLKGSDTLSCAALGEPSPAATFEEQRQLSFPSDLDWESPLEAPHPAPGLSLLRLLTCSTSTDFKYFVWVVSICAVVLYHSDVFLPVQGGAEVSFPYGGVFGIRVWIVVTAGYGPSLEGEGDRKESTLFSLPVLYPSSQHT